MSAIWTPAIQLHSSFYPNTHSSLITPFLFKPQNSLKNHKQPTHNSHTSGVNSSISPAKYTVLSSKQGGSDPELRTVLQLATDSELFELNKILFGPSYFSPLLKSISNGSEFDRFMVEQDFDERDQFIAALESRFMFLAADARSTLRGWRPSYRNVLLDARKQLSIPCSSKLPTEDLELEIFIHMIHECTRFWDTGAAIRIRAADLRSMLLKGGQLISLLKISELLSGKMLLETAKHKVKGEVIKKGVAGSASRALGFRSLASFFGPILWGTLLADIVIQMLGTDYARVLQAIYAFAQIRVLRRYGLHLDKLETGF